MKRLVSFITFLCLSAWASFGQDLRTQTLNLVYVYHSSDIRVGALCTDLTNLYKDARNYNVPTLFYMPNMNTPYIVYVDRNSDGGDVFPTIINELQEKRYHNSNPATDLKMLSEYFSDKGLIREDGTVKYPYMNWRFYVNSGSWDDIAGIISKLCFIFDLEKYYNKDNFSLSVLYSGEELNIDKKYPLGELNLCPAFNDFEIQLF